MLRATSASGDISRLSEGDGTRCAFGPIVMYCPAAKWLRARVVARSRAAALPAATSTHVKALARVAAQSKHCCEAFLECRRLYPDVHPARRSPASVVRAYGAFHFPDPVSGEGLHPLGRHAPAIAEVPLDAVRQKPMV